MASCLDDEYEIPLKVIDSFSTVHFSLPSSTLIVLHNLVRYDFWSMVYVHRCVSGCLYSVLAVQSRFGLFLTLADVVSPGYLYWYRFLVESVT